MNMVSRTHYTNNPCLVESNTCHHNRYFVDSSYRLMFSPEIGEQVLDTDFNSDQPCVRAFRLMDKP